MTDNTKRVLIDAVVFFVIVALGWMIFDEPIMGIFAGLLFGGGADVVQRKG